MTKYYYTDDQGNICPPKPLETLFEMFHQGKLPQNCRVYIENEKQWKLLSSIIAKQNPFKQLHSYERPIISQYTSRFPPKKQLSAGGGFLIALAMVFLCILIASFSTNSKSTGHKQSAAQQTNSFDDKADLLFSPWSGANDQLVALVKSNLHHPDSFEHIETRYEKHSSTEVSVGMKFRAKNGFGGTRTTYAYFIQDVYTKSYRDFYIEAR